MNDNLLKIGEIVAAQGIKGEVKVYPDSDFPERFTKKGLRYLRAKDGQDIREYEMLEQYFENVKPDIIIHLASFAGVPNGEIKPYAYLSNNIFVIPFRFKAFNSARSFLPLTNDSNSSLDI